MSDEELTELFCRELSELSDYYDVSEYEQSHILRTMVTHLKIMLLKAKHQEAVKDESKSTATSASTSGSDSSSTSTTPTMEVLIGILVAIGVLIFLICVFR